MPSVLQRLILLSGNQANAVGLPRQLSLSLMRTRLCRFRQGLPGGPGDAGRLGQGQEFPPARTEDTC